MIYVVFMVVLVPPGPTRIETEHFIVQHERTASETAKIAAEAAEKAYVNVKHLLGIEAPSPVMIVVISSGGAFGKDKRPLPGDLPGWAVGSAYPAKRLIFISQPHGVSLRYRDIAEVVTHEYTHIAVGSYLGDMEIPRWFDEGVADFVGGGRSWTASFSIGVAAITGRLIPLDALRRWWPTSRREAEVAYAQGADFVAFVENKHGPGAIKNILYEMRSSGKFEAAVLKATGKKLAELETEWLKRVVRVYRWVPILSGGLTIWAFGSMLVIIGYVRKKRISKLKYHLWEIEERLDKLGKEDVEISEEDELENPLGKDILH